MWDNQKKCTKVSHCAYLYGSSMSALACLNPHRTCVTAYFSNIFAQSFFPRCPRGLHWCNREENWGRTCTLGASEIMRTIQTHLADNNISGTVGRQRARHVMNNVNLDKHGLDLILSSRDSSAKIPQTFSDNNNWTRVLFPRDTYLFLPNIPLSTCQTQMYAKPQHRKTQTQRSQKHVKSTLMSHISKQKFYFWRGKTFPEPHPKVLCDNLCHNRPLSWLWILHGFDSSQKHVLGRFFFNRMRQKHLFFF